jgi:hypothetical protein
MSFLLSSRRATAHQAHRAPGLLWGISPGRAHSGWLRVAEYAKRWRLEVAVLEADQARVDLEMPL